ncbi:MAG: FdhF/YdeP family oxidoreductase [Candidatus Eisenbacteria bacterium]|nr:FdhF/YdeP family oxidoreductase [Candidatus Eisenbacteria bacterium]
MAKPKVSAGGGIPALLYVHRKSGEAGGFFRLWNRLRSRNACKTCALGMGGVRGGMVNEAGHFPEICKKSIQAQAGDMAGALDERTLAETPVERLAQLTPRELEYLGRVTFPMVHRKGDSHYRRASWAEALDRAGDALRGAAPEETFFYSSGRSSNEAAFLFQLIARAYGTANVHNCSAYCHAASGVALSKVYGSGTASVVLEDLASADLAIVIGANPASNHPRLVTQLVEMRERGGTIIVVNPLEELGLVRFRIPSKPKSFLFGSDVSDLYVKPHIGGDIAFLVGVLKSVIERGGVDESFVSSFTEGWDTVREDVMASSWTELEARSGVPRSEIEQVAEAVLRAKRGIFFWAMGLTHHEHGVDNILALANLALARGWLGRPGVGLLPIRGHSNVQGVGSVGVGPYVKRAFAERMGEIYGVDVRPGGLDTYDSMVAADEGKMRAAVLLGGNLFGSNPNRDWAARALSRIPYKCYLSTKLNEGHAHGLGDETWILPVLARDEEGQTTTQESMFNLVRVSEGGRPAVDGEMRSEVEILASVAERILPPGRFDWKQMRSHATLREAISKTVPGYSAIAEIDRTHGGVSGEFQIEGRTFHEPQFSTPSGKAQFHSTPLPRETAPDHPLASDELRIMTIRSEGQFNTVVYEEEDLYRGNEHRNVLMLSAEDAMRWNLEEGDTVSVENEVGRMEVQVAIVSIRAGNGAMYYPEANVLVPRRIDPKSGTPAFKAVRARVRKLA